MYFCCECTEPSELVGVFAGLSKFDTSDTTIVVSFMMVKCAANCKTNAPKPLYKPETPSFAIVVL